MVEKVDVIEVKKEVVIILFLFLEKKMIKVWFMLKELIYFLCELMKENVECW